MTIKISISCKQHSNVKERTEVKEGKLGRFAPYIYDVSKL